MFTPDIKLISLSKNAEEKIAQIARVSSKNPDNTSTALLKYLIKNKHWSPFEMMTMTIRIETTRDISRQIIRHRSFSYQEFSQRYQDIKEIQSAPCVRQARLQDTKNRQNSIITKDDTLQKEWSDIQNIVWKTCIKNYREALAKGVAKEQARCLLPEGLTKTVIYMTGSIRSWMHYIDLRSGNGTQKEHMDVANAIKKIFITQLPCCAAAMNWV